MPVCDLTNHVESDASGDGGKSGQAGLLVYQALKDPRISEDLQILKSSLG